MKKYRRKYLITWCSL